ncbi:MAG: MGMT family protein [Erysipelotrichaceae bacterium]|nr:MGMT family protein [Erysipelotrichaceae bacterium]
MTYDKKVYDFLKLIPKGKVVTYGDIAEYLGNKKLSRVVGNILHKNPDPIGSPCYKVVNSQGKLAARFGDGGIEVQRRRLNEDGIEVEDYTVDLQRYRWDRNNSSTPTDSETEQEAK